MPRPPLRTHTIITCKEDEKKERETLKFCPDHDGCKGEMLPQRSFKGAKVKMENGEERLYRNSKCNMCASGKVSGDSKYHTLETIAFKDNKELKITIEQLDIDLKKLKIKFNKHKDVTNRILNEVSKKTGLKFDSEGYIKISSTSDISEIKQELL